MNKESRIFVAGHRGLVGSAVVRALRHRGYTNLLVRERKDLELTNQAQVRDFFEYEKPEIVIDAAAKVGGILANDQRPADFIRDNLLIQTNMIDAAFRAGVDKLVFLGSSCIYPKLSEQPINEKSLLTGPLESTNEWYAIAKIAGVKMCQAYRRQHGFNTISLMPTNLYGPGDNFDLRTSHVMPALIRKFHQAKVNDESSVTIWGTGTPRREFLYVDDLADAVLFLTEQYDVGEIINVGMGEDISIAELAKLIAEIVGFGGGLKFDVSMPDGTPRKLLDISQLRSLGWNPSCSLREGISLTYSWFIDNYCSISN